MIGRKGVKLNPASVYARNFGAWTGKRNLIKIKKGRKGRDLIPDRTSSLVKPVCRSGPEEEEGNRERVDELPRIHQRTWKILQCTIFNEPRTQISSPASSPDSFSPASIFFASQLLAPTFLLNCNLHSLPLTRQLHRIQR